MLSPLPLPIVYAGLAGVLLALIVATAQQRWQLRTFFLLALRLAIGWHFLFEGLHKIHSDRVGPTDTNKSFSSEFYFKASPTAIGATLRQKFDNPQAVIAARLKLDSPLTLVEFRKLSDNGKAAACPKLTADEFDALLDDAVKQIKTEAATEKATAEKALADEAQNKELIDARDAKRIIDAEADAALAKAIQDVDAAHYKSVATSIIQSEDVLRPGRLMHEKATLQMILAEQAAKLQRTQDLQAKEKSIAEGLAKKVKAADEKAAKAEELAKEKIKSAKLAYAAWVVGAEGLNTKVKHTTGEVAMTAPRRLAQLDALRTELANSESRIGFGLGNGNGVDVKHANDLRMELLAAESELAKDSLALDAKKALTGKDAEVPKADAEGKRLDKFTMWFIAIVGACILFGLFTRLACLAAAGFLVMTVLSHPAVPWYPLPPNTEGNPLFVNKNVIECLALLVLACYPTGRWLGLDAWVSRFIFGRRELVPNDG